MICEITEAVKWKRKEHVPQVKTLEKIKARSALASSNTAVGEDLQSKASAGKKPTFTLHTA